MSEPVSAGRAPQFSGTTIVPPEESQKPASQRSRPAHTGHGCEQGDSEQGICLRGELEEMLDGGKESQTVARAPGENLDVVFGVRHQPDHVAIFVGNPGNIVA